MTAMRDRGRIIVCGEIASAYRDNSGTGIRNSFQIIASALQVLGLRVDLYYHRAGEAAAQLAQWAQAGHLHSRIHRLQDLENAPKALNMLFTGGNLGKLMVQVSPPPQQ